MKMIEIVNLLANTPSYATTRVHIDNSVIDLIRTQMGHYYDLIKNKEELYQQMIAEVGPDRKEEFIQFLKELSNNINK